MMKITSFTGGILASLCLLIFLSLNSIAQENFPVTGKVTDELGAPLVGATIKVKGTDRNATSDAQGFFRINANSGTATLIVSYVGYEIQEVAIAKRSEIAFLLKPLINSMEDVVVIGYGTRKRSDVTGAVSSISAKQIEQVPTTNLTQALQGRLPGVVVNTTNFRPGETPFIRIRGNRSFATGGGFNSVDNPVVVVDGIITPYSLSDFNPLDIESVDVLKDASATAIYGARGANGVIIVTTKKGKAGKLSVDVHSYMSFDSPLRDLDVLNAGEFAELRRQANRNVNATFPRYATPASDLSIFPEPITRESVLMGYQWRDRANLIPVMRVTTADEKSAWGVDSVPVFDPSGVRNTDWQKLGLQTGITQNYQVRVSGGTEKMRGSFSGDYYKQKGVQLGSDYTRYSGALNLDFKPSKLFGMGAVMNASTVIQNYGPEIYGGVSGQLPIALPDTNGVFIYRPGEDINIVNPLRDPTSIFDERRINRFFGSFYAELSPLKGLRFRVNFGPDISNVRRGTFNGSASSSKQGNALADASYNYNNYFNWVLENLVFYDKQIGDDHNIGITLLQSLQKERTEGSSMSARNLINEASLWYSLQTNTEATVTGFSSSFAQTQLQSYMTRVNYGFKNRYLLTLTGRWDGASQLAPGNKWTFFPSAAIAWKIDQEDFMKNVTAVDQLKLRIGYGSVGQPGIGAYSVAGPLATRPYSWDEAVVYGFSPGLSAPQATWPVTTTANIGVDFGFLKGRISGSIEVYRQDTKNQVQTRAIPGTSGFTSILYNVGHVRNSGVEVSLSTVNIQSRSFKWTTDITFSRNKEQVLDIDGTKTDNLGNRWFIGKPIAVWYDYQFDGIYQDTKEDLDKIKGLITKTPSLGTGFNALSPGIIKVRDINGDSLINQNDLTVLGSPMPSWTSGFNNTFTYRNFDLSVYAYISWGGMLNSIRSRISMGGRYQQLDVPYWTAENKSNEYPKPILNNDIPLFGAALQYQDASFVRIRSISLQYNFPKSFISKYLRANNLSVYVNAVNPFLFSKFKILDPEVVNAGTTSTVGTSVFFSTKSFVFGLKLGL
ncbi:TonB-dependent receptor [Terrimonas sp. NA20]|uniref:TonB-dependent receptor n=1 Tax=Terrimonas ginsenosidimutans TaxID=2908004 RepID=A0ABS9KPI2_9BACT|nr:TonB-dependent receptor [Terrimonas ginsenosidimutans]MCG2614240.1 TonB-dependent receptor [Terrimonas ginsenosidimutans]